MEWSDEGIVLFSRAHGETSAIVELLTASHGRHLGLVRGGRSRRLRPLLQTGNLVHAKWRARLSEHLGSYAIELLDARAARVLDDRKALAGLNSLAVLALLLPEREPHAGLFKAASLVIQAFGDGEYWPALLARWEMGLLEDLGFGLDFSSCAGTGVTTNLDYVSPRSGRAISREAGEPYKEKLFRLPAFLLPDKGQGSAPTADDVAHGFRLTGYFLNKNVWGPRNLQPPAARERLIALLGAD